VLAVAWCAAGAALLARARGRVAVAVGATAIAVGVATAPLTTPPLAAGMALVVTGAPGGSTSRQARPKPPAAGARRWVSVLLVLFAGGLAVDLLADGPGGPGGPLHGSEQAVLLLLGGLVIVPALVVRNLRAPAVAAAAAVVVAALPLTGAGDALPLVIALVALLAALLVDHVARQPVSARPHPLLRAAIVIPVLVMVVVGALFSPRGVAERPHADLARWLVAPEARGGVLAVSPGLWGDLLRDGVPPGRLVEAGTPDAGRADWVVRSGAAAAGVEPTEQFRSGAGALTVQPSDAALARSRVAIDIQRSAEEARQRQAEADRDERRLVGGLLARSPGVEAPPEVRAALADGAVDMGALRALAALTAGWHDLRVGPLPAPAGTSAAPATSLVLTSFDGLPATLPDVVATIDALSGDAAAAEHVVDRSGLLLSWPPQGRAGALRFQVPT
jgi:putative peptide zinc metalloprotease protein